VEPVGLLRGGAIRGGTLGVGAGLSGRGFFCWCRRFNYDN